MSRFEIAAVAYGTLVFMGVFGSMGVRQWVIVRTLKKGGGSFTTGLFTWRVYAEVKAYRRLREERGESLFWWRVWWALHLGGGVLIAIGWLVAPLLDR